MLSKTGDPGMGYLAAIIGALRQRLGLDLDARTVEAAQARLGQLRRLR